jgi:hypothetical protein
VYHSNELSLVFLGRCEGVANFGERRLGEVRGISLLGGWVNRARDASGGYANYMEDLQCLVDAPVTSRQLNNLFAFAWSWEGHEWRDFKPVLKPRPSYAAWEGRTSVVFCIFR